jgi:adenosine deaminase
VSSQLEGKQPIAPVAASETIRARELTIEFLRQLPKTDLHCHLDGSLRVETILEMAGQRKVRLPSEDPDRLRKILIQDDAASLVDYLKAFDVTLSVMQDYESLQRVAFELIEDAAAENVRYIEVRYAPLLHQQKGMKLTQIVDAVIEGLQEGERRFGVRWGIIICGMRMTDPKFTIQMAELCIAYKHRGVVGFDLAGAEAENPAKHHREAFQLILNNNINVTIHAGEAYGPESIAQALHYCGAHRLGHAVRLKENGDLLSYCNDHRIPLEICLTSNLQTGAVDDLAFHPLRLYYDCGLRCCLSTDNRLMSGTTVTKELWLAHKHLGFTLPELKDLIVFGFKSTFMRHRPKVELLQAALVELKKFTNPQVGAETPTGSAVADIPTEAFTRSKKPNGEDT